MIKTERKKFAIKLTEDLLGTVTKDAEVYRKFVLSKHLKEEDNLDVEKLKEEMETVEDTGEKGATGFHSDEQGIFIYDYMLRGFLKCGCEVAMASGAINKIVAYKKWIDLLVFVKPRKLRFSDEDTNTYLQKPDGELTRPIRTITPKGPRVALLKSDHVKAGRVIIFDIELIKNSKGLTWKVLKEILYYGTFVGLGQWRGSGGYGRFEVLDDEQE